MSARGKLIAFEGIDGAGKSTQIQRLAARLDAAGHPVTTTREPTDGPWGKKIRSSAETGRMSPADELAAFIEDRRQHVRELIEPSLDAGRTVLIDRYYFSTVAYQGARGLEPTELLAANAFAPAPDLLLLFDLPPRVSLERVRSRGGGVDLFEREDELTRVREIFLSLEAPGRVVLDALRGEDEIEREIWQHVEPLVDPRPT